MHLLHHYDMICLMLHSFQFLTPLSFLAIVLHVNDKIILKDAHLEMENKVMACVAFILLHVQDAHNYLLFEKITPNLDQVVAIIENDLHMELERT